MKTITSAAEDSKKITALQATMLSDGTAQDGRTTSGHDSSSGPGRAHQGHAGSPTGATATHSSDNQPSVTRKADGTYEYSDVQKFRKDWEADGKSQLRATFDKKAGTMSLLYQDDDHADHKITMKVGEESVGRFAASDYDSGEYHLGGREPAFKGGAWMDGDDGTRHSDKGVGLASIPIVQGDGENRVVAHLPDGTRVSPDGSDVMLHGGGSKLFKTQGPEAPFAPEQDLIATEACIRAHNYDAVGIAEMVRESGGFIPLTVR